MSMGEISRDQCQLQRDGEKRKQVNYLNSGWLNKDADLEKKIIMRFKISHKAVRALVVPVLSCVLSTFETSTLDSCRNFIYD